MSQQEVLNFLEKNKNKVWTSKEIAEYLKIRQDSVLKNLRKLLKYNEVGSRRITKKEIKEKGLENKHITTRFRIFFSIDNRK